MKKKIQSLPVAIGCDDGRSDVLNPSVKVLTHLLRHEQSFSSLKDYLKQRHSRDKIAQTDKRNDRRRDKLKILKLKLFKSTQNIFIHKFRCIMYVHLELSCCISR